MVQDFTTSFDQFETFALSEMAKQPEIKTDFLSPFTPKYWSNKDSATMTSLYEETKLGRSFQNLFSPRRSGRIATQRKINYNENIPKKESHTEKNRHKKNRKRKPNNRTKEIRKLFKKPNETEGGKTKSDNKKVYSKHRSKTCIFPTELKISIPLTKTYLFNPLSKRASLRSFDQAIKQELSSFQITDHSNETQAKNKRSKPKNLTEISEETKHSSNKSESTNHNNIPTEKRESFSGIFKSYKDDSGVELESLASNDHHSYIKTPNEVKDDDMEISNEHENQNVPEDCQMMETSNESPKENIQPNSEKEQPLDLTLMDYSNDTWKSNNLNVQNQNTEKDQLPENSVQTYTNADDKPKTDENLFNCKESLLSECLSSMKISEIIQNPENNQNKILVDRSEPFDLTLNTTSEVFSNSNKSTLSNNTESSNNNKNNVFIVENIPLSQNDANRFFLKYQSSNSALSELLDQNSYDRQGDFFTKTEKMLEKLKSIIEGCPFVQETDNSKDVSSADATNDSCNPPDTIENEVEICGESNDSDIEIIEDRTLSNDGNKSEQNFNKHSDDVEMRFPSGCNPAYQQEYIEIHPYNYVPFQNYQHPQNEHPSHNLSFLAQRYADLQEPCQMSLADYNYYRNVEKKSRLEIKEISDEEESIVAKPKSAQNCCNSNQTKTPVLSQPPPIQCSFEQYSSLKNLPEHQMFSKQNMHNPLMEKQHQTMSGGNTESLSHIAELLKNNCRIHEVDFGQIQVLNGKLFRTGSLLITFGDHYKVQVVGDLIPNTIDDNDAFDAYFN